MSLEGEEYLLSLSWVDYKNSKAGESVEAPSSSKIPGTALM